MKEFLLTLVSSWWGIFLICIVSITLTVLISALLYRPIFKRVYDVLLSGIAIIVLSPLLLCLIIVGAIKMKGNPFFTQKRPGKIGKDGNEKIFTLIKFRTMSNAKDKDGKLLPDDVRLNKYGRMLRSTSLDELPELFNIFIGDMSIVGPRPLLVSYLPYYTEEERHRHNVRPGLTGLAQVNGRNAISWEEKFSFDIKYVNNISLFADIKIILQTVLKVIKKSDILVGAEHKVGKLNEERSKKQD
ncbi:MAG: sugar transferase [Clostridia bacterium]|nr:sugar transferase [Clostridia bacterium]